MDSSSSIISWWWWWWWWLFLLLYCRFCDNYSLSIINISTTKLRSGVAVSLVYFDGGGWGGVGCWREGRASRAPAAATSLRPLNDWLSSRLQAQSVTSSRRWWGGEEHTFDPLLHFLLWLLHWSRENKRRTTTWLEAPAPLHLDCKPG